MVLVIDRVLYSGGNDYAGQFSICNGYIHTGQYTSFDTISLIICLIKITKTKGLSLCVKPGVSFIVAILLHLQLFFSFAGSTTVKNHTETKHELFGYC